MWKEITKRLNSPDSFVSLILGLAVVLVIGTLVFNYFAGKANNKTTQEEKTTVMEEQTASPNKHTVSAGETLWSISEKYYKSGYNWVDLQKANTIANADTIEVGQELIIPNATPIVPQGDISAASTVTKPQTYTVVHGDSLWNIAKQFYNGDGYQWVQIAQANSLANPNLIHAGNVLTLP